MKRLLSLFFAFTACIQMAFAYDFSAVAPTGQTLYYKIVSGGVRVTYPDWNWEYHQKPTGHLIIPDSVIYGGNYYLVIDIDNYAFENCTGLTSVTIPNSINSVNSISCYAFEGCSNISSPIYNSTLFAFMPSSYSGEYVIPSGITIIGHGAFHNCSNLTSVSIPNSVTTIGNYAFLGSGITVPIYTDTFFAYLPASYSGAYTVPTGITTIGGSAFSGCNGLTAVTIPNSVISIGTFTFSNCSGLTSVTIGNSVTSIGQYAFRNCSGLTSVTIPNSVTSIGNNAFMGCSGLTSVTIPNSVTSIGNNAFMGCSGLTSVTIPNSVTSIGSSAFAYCSGLTSVTISNSVTSIGNSAFGHCISLTSVIIPNSVTTIGREAFYKCSSLTSITIPNSVTSIGDSTFSGCRGLISVSIGKNVESIGLGAFKNCSALTSVEYNADSCVIANSSSDYYNRPFSGCPNITNFVIGNNVRIIPENLCTGLSQLTSIVIPDSVIAINNNAFKGCSGLISVTIGRAVKSIGLDAFKNCNALASVEYNADSCVFINSYYSSEYGLFYNSRSTITNLTFGDNVKIIPAFLCYNLSGLTSITLPTDVSYIGEWAFRGCSGLTSIQIPNSVTSIGVGAFYGCDHLTNITLGCGLQTIGEKAFEGCTQVVRIKSYSTEAPTVQSNTFSDLSDNVVVNVPCGSASVYENAAYWLRFDIQEDLMYTFSVTSGNPSQGTVQVIKQPTCDDAEAVVQAHAYHNYHFVRWSDGNTDSLRYIVVTQDTAIQAEFAEGSGTEGIDNIKDDDILIYSIDGRIHVVVGNHPQDEFRVFDVMGREIFYTTQGDETPQFPAGVYLVKLRGLPARKVVVIR